MFDGLTLDRPARSEAAPCCSRFRPLLDSSLVIVVVLPAQLDQDPCTSTSAASIFRLGKLLPQPKGPGVILVFAPIDRMVRVSLRTVVMDVPPQDVITRDNVSVKVNAVVYFRVMDPRRAIVEVESYHYATSQLAQTTLRSVLGQVELDDLLSERERLNQQLQQILDQHTDPWGIKVSAVEVKHVDLPPDMQRAMARQAEAEREKRAKIIHAAGELEASEKLAQAAAVIATEPVAITLRYLQTLTEIAAEKNSTIIFPLPIEMMHLVEADHRSREEAVSDEGFREIQLNGKQLIFLFMAVTVVLVVTFLFGVLTGRGVREDAAATEIASGEVAPDSGARAGGQTARRRLRLPAAPASQPPAAPATEELSYAERLLRDTPAEENLKPSTPSGAPRHPLRSFRSQSPTRRRRRRLLRSRQKPLRRHLRRPGQRPRTWRTRTTARPANASPGSAAAAQPSDPTGPGYAVQVAAYRDRRDADTLAKQLTAKGLSGIRHGSREGAPTTSLFRVRVGKYQDAEGRRRRSRRGSQSAEQLTNAWIAR